VFRLVSIYPLLCLTLPSAEAVLLQMFHKEQKEQLENFRSGMVGQARGNARRENPTFFFFF